MQRLYLEWIALPVRFATCPPAALNVVSLLLVGFATSSFTSAKRTDSTILRRGWRANKIRRKLWSFAAIDIVHAPQ